PGGEGAGCARRRARRRRRPRRRSGTSAAARASLRRPRHNPTVRLCTLGDLLLDVIVRLESPLEPGDHATAAPSLEPADLAANDLEPEWLACDALHLSGYSIMREPIAGAAARAAELARAHGATVSVDLSSWTHIERFGDTMRATLNRIGPDLVFGNEREW